MLNVKFSKLRSLNSVFSECPFSWLRQIIWRNIFQFHFILSGKDDIWAIYNHMLLGPAGESLDKQHSFCPKSSDTWCKYQRDVINNTTEYNRKKCLPYVFRAELKTIFVCLSSIFFFFNKMLLKIINFHND